LREQSSGKIGKQSLIATVKRATLTPQVVRENQKEGSR
jgi:hypothetical protein